MPKVRRSLPHVYILSEKINSAVETSVATTTRYIRPLSWNIQDGDCDPLLTSTYILCEYGSAFSGRV